MRPRSPRLRFTTWLSPGLPEALFATIAAWVGAGLGRDHELHVEARFSGPVAPGDDRFALDLTDVGFLCPPSFLWLSDRTPPSVVLVPLAPVYDDPRAAGRPVYFSDIVVRAESDIRSFDDLAGKRVGYNDHSSLSGYVSLLGRLADDGTDESFFAEFRNVGSHRRSLSSIASGEIDAAAIDANVWRPWVDDSRSPMPTTGGGLRSIEVLGPFPVQPLVVRAAVADELVEPLCGQLRQPELVDALRPFGVTAFAPVSDTDYATLRSLVERGR